MTEHAGGTAWELREAENAMVAAVDDPAARIVAMRRHTEAVRNMMQGELMPSFVEALGRVLDTKLEPLLTGQKETHSSVTALSRQFRAITKSVKELQTRMTASEADRADLRARLERIEKAIGEAAILEALRLAKRDGGGDHD